jgi:DNA primase large subunit
MTTTAIKKQVEDYLPMLSTKQQVLVLEMIKSLLHVDNENKRITKKQYNKELDEAVERIEKGKSISHRNALKEIAKW